MTQASQETRPTNQPGNTEAWDAPRAVLFDLDGTLYDQRVLRKAMIWELMGAPLTRGPLGAWRIAKVLKSFRRLRETLRLDAEAARASGLALNRPLLELQFERPAEALGLPVETVQAVVTEWMFEKPLKHLARAGWSDMRVTLNRLKDAGMRLGVFSDYPPAAKLEALGLADLFDVAISATDKDVDAFKPDPKGFLRGAELLGQGPEEVIYVGDRWDVDARGADMAGMRSVILQTGLGHVGATDQFQAEIESLAQSGRARSIQVFKEVGDALGLR